MENLQYYRHLSELLAAGKSLWQATIIATEGSSPARAGMKMLISPGEKPFGNLGGGELEHNIINHVLQTQPETAHQLSFDLSGKALPELSPTAMICGGSATVFIEPLHMGNKLYIIGGGHCGKALGRLTLLSGFEVTIIDNRPDSLEEIQLDTAHHCILNDYQDISSAIRFGKGAWVVIMTHGHLHDKQVLQQCLRQSTRYLGMIGSKSKVKETFNTLMQQGYSESELARVHAPIGLPIGSQTPYEIAISIMAEIIGELRKK